MEAADLVDDHVCKDPVDRPWQQKRPWLLKSSQTNNATSSNNKYNLIGSDRIWKKCDIIECHRMIWIFLEKPLYICHPCHRFFKQNSMNVLQSVSDYTTCLEPIRIALAALAAASSASVAERCFSCLQPQVISPVKRLTLTEARSQIHVFGLVVPIFSRL